MTLEHISSYTRLLRLKPCKSFPYKAFPVVFGALYNRPVITIIIIIIVTTIIITVIIIIIVIIIITTIIIIITVVVVVTLMGLTWARRRDALA